MTDFCFSLTSFSGHVFSYTNQDLAKFDKEFHGSWVGLLMAMND